MAENQIQGIQRRDRMRYFGADIYVKEGEPVVMQGVITQIGRYCGKPAIRFKKNKARGRVVWCILEEPYPMLSSALIWNKRQVTVEVYGCMSFSYCGELRSFSKCRIRHPIGE